MNNSLYFASNVEHRKQSGTRSFRMPALLGALLCAAGLLVIPEKTFSQVPQGTIEGGGGIPCEDLVSFQARCISGGGGNKLQAQLPPPDRSHSGEQVTITVDGN